MTTGCDGRAWGERLSALVDGELEEGERRATEAHLAACEGCRARLDALDRAAGLAGASADADPRPDLHRFLERLEARLDLELRLDPRLRAGAGGGAAARLAGSGRYVVRRRAGPALARVAAAIAIAALGALAYRFATSERAGRPPSVIPPERPEVARDGATPAPPPPVRSPAPESGNGDGGAGGGAIDRALARIERAAPPAAIEPAPPRGAEHASAPPPPPPPEPQPGTEVVTPAPGPSPGPAPSPRERAAAVARLAAVVRDGARPLERRKEALYEIAALGGPESAGLLREVLRERPGIYLSLRDDAVRALGAYPSRDGLYVLIDAARAHPLEVRAALAAIRDEAILAWLAADVLPRLDDRHAEARLILAETLARARAPGAGAAIAAAIEKVRDLATRARLVIALGDAGDDAARAALARALEDPRDAIRAAAWRGLGRAGEAALAVARRARGGMTDRSARVNAAARIAELRQGQVPASLSASPRFAGVPLDTEGVLFLVDQSDSMRRSGAAARARAAVERALRDLPAGTPFATGAFAADTRLHGPERASPAAIEAALRFLDAQRFASGATDLGEALRRALGLEGIDQIFLFTDGAPTAGPAAGALLEQLRAATWDGSVCVHAVALFDPDPEKPLRIDNPGRPASGPLAFLRRLAEDGGGLCLRND